DKIDDIGAFKLAREIKERIESVIKIFISLIVFLFSFVFYKESILRDVIRIVATLIAGYEILIEFFKKIIKFNFLDENTLMVIASITAFILGESVEGFIIVLLYGIGEMLEDIATEKSKNKILKLKSLEIKTVRLIKDGVAIDVEPSMVEIGSIIEIKKGEKIPIDGEMLNDGDLDMKALNGESKIYQLRSGEIALSGAINIGEVIRIKTTKSYTDSTLKKIISAIENANSNKSKEQKFITSFAKIYTPIIVALAIVISVVPPLFDGMSFTKWIYKGLTFLVISCPCALIISVPLAFFVGIGKLADNGVLVKGSLYIDLLTKCDTIMFDKTGTLTMGNLNVDKVIYLDDYSEEEVVKTVASIEQFSNHPLAKAVCDYYKKPLYEVKNIEEISGFGIKGKIKNKEVEVGNKNVLKDADIRHVEKEQTAIYLIVNSRLKGVITFSDAIRKESEDVINNLKKMGIKNTIMVSGDSDFVCSKVYRALPLDKYYSEKLPLEKEKIVKKYKKYNTLMFVGDGINDSLSLVSSDIGVAMGKAGSDIAIDSADVVLINDKLDNLCLAIKESKRIKRKVFQNIVVSIFVKFAIMTLSVFVGVPIWLSMFADVGIMLLAVVNSLCIK
ncbi:MAG: cadmium-translocating P-type ATPase, partial [Clostridia bacterium]|nr:cadmium-translocating P-type ATPase [Clostridia bacterium]